MRKLTFISCIILSISLHAQQLFFIRATADAEYEFYDLPPVQVFIYKCSQDSALQVYKDYTKNIYKRFKRLKAIVHYPEFNMFCFTVSGFQSYMLDGNRADTIIELITQCPSNYHVSPFLSMNIINGHWAYQCTNSSGEIFKGMDFYLKKQFDISANDFKNIYLTGINTQDVELKPNDKNMYLPIVTDISKRPVFSVELPQKYWVNEAVYKWLYVNDDLQTLLLLKQSIPMAGEDYGHFYGGLYHKTKKEWFDIELKGNAPKIIAYGYWLAGIVQDMRDNEQRYYPNKLSPGKTVRDSVYAEDSFDEWALNYGIYRPGILYLYNTDTQKYIEWNTEQGDSEILLVQDETVYYRVFDKIYKAAIINGEALGEPELLVKDSSIVPQIHWAFLGSKRNEI